MAKRLLLIFMALLLMQGVCFAKIQKGEDKFEGQAWYFVDHSSNIPGMGYVDATFIVFFEQNKYDGKGFGITISKDDGYRIDDTIKMQIDDIIYTWQTNSDSVRSAFVKRSFPIPSNVYEALMKTKQNVAVRFYYSALSGDYQEDFVIPYKTIKEAQTLFTTYVPQATSPEQPAN